MLDLFSLVIYNNIMTIATFISMTESQNVAMKEEHWSSEIGRQGLSPSRAVLSEICDRR